MPNDDAGHDTGIHCPSCEERTMLTAADNKRRCPQCGYSEPHEPITRTTTKDYLHA